MVALRLAILIGVTTAGGFACAASPPVWQPYREFVAPPVPKVVVPAQYEYVESQDVPVDAITDFELNALNAANCHSSAECPAPCTEYSIPSTQYSVLGTPFAQPSTQSSIELLPGDVIWHSYWAGAKEPRTSGTVFQETGDDLTLLDVTLGGRSSILRQAVRNDQGLWQGWELQIEGAAILRLNLDQNWDFDSTDFRFGVPLILARNQLHWKFAYYHLSSHVGDEFLVRNPGFMRINFSRDVLVFGASYFPLPAWRWYAEAGWAFYDDEGSDPFEFQFGFDYARPGHTGSRGTPFVALNGHLREEVNFGGNLALQAGWLWRGQTGRVLRTGLHYYSGKSSQFEFFDQFEQQIGFGLWQEY